MKKASFYTMFNSLPARETRITCATMFTITRILLAPVIAYAMIYNYWTVAFSLFVCAALTDMIDGYIARNFDQKTLLGASLDPLADKVLLITCFVTLAYLNTSLFPIPGWFIDFFIAKELIQVFGFLWLFCYKKVTIIEPSVWGKITTAVQIVFIVWLFGCFFFDYTSPELNNIFVSILCVCMGITFVQYVYKGFALIQNPTGAVNE